MRYSSNDDDNNIYIHISKQEVTQNMQNNKHIYIHKIKYKNASKNKRESNNNDIYNLKNYSRDEDEAGIINKSRSILYIIK